jgi:hypothetical protein
MDIGDIVILGGARFYVRGFDPVGVNPRFVYLKDARTGKTISVALEEPLPRTDHGVLRLVDDDPQEQRSKE